MSKPEYNDKNIAKLAQEVVDGWDLKTCMQILYENQVELYEHNWDMFEDDWLEMEMEE